MEFEVGGAGAVFGVGGAVGVGVMVMMSLREGVHMYCYMKGAWRTRGNASGKQGLGIV